MKRLYIDIPRKFGQTALAATLVLSALTWHAYAAAKAGEKKTEEPQAQTEQPVQPAQPTPELTIILSGPQADMVWAWLNRGGGCNNTQSYVVCAILTDKLQQAASEATKKQKPK